MPRVPDDQRRRAADVGDRVEQLLDRRRQRQLGAGPDVLPVAGHDQPAARGEDRVEQPRPRLVAGVALAGQRRRGQQVIGVGRRGRGDGADVDDRDDPGGHPAQRRQGRDRDAAAARVATPAAGRDAVEQRRADLEELQRCLDAGGRGVRGERHHGRAHLAGGDGLRVVDVVVRAGRDEPAVDDGQQRRSPAGHRTCRAGEPDEVTEGAQGVCEPREDGDVLSADVDGGCDPGDDVARRVQQHAREQPVHALAPGPGRDAVGVAPALAVGGVDAPAQVELVGGAREQLEVVVLEPERGPHHRQHQQGQDLVALGAAGGDVQQRLERTDHGGRTEGRPVSDTDGQAVSGDLRAEDRTDQRRDAPEIGTEHQHVTRLEPVVVLERVQQRVAQDLELTHEPVAGVDLDAAVAPAAVVAQFARHGGAGAVGRDALAEPAELVRPGPPGRRRARRGIRRDVERPRAEPVEHAGRGDGGPPPGRQQRVGRGDPCRTSQQRRRRDWGQHEDVAVLGAAPQQRRGRRREVPDAEDHQTVRQPSRRGPRCARPDEQLGG